MTTHGHACALCHRAGPSLAVPHLCTGKGSVGVQPQPLGGFPKRTGQKEGGAEGQAAEHDGKMEAAFRGREIQSWSPPDPESWGALLREPGVKAVAVPPTEVFLHCQDLATRAQRSSLMGQ